MATSTTDERFLLAFGFTMRWEKGMVDDPDDLGGRTKDGITQATYDKYRTAIGKPTLDVFLASSDEIRDIYYRIWKTSRAAYVKNTYLAIVMFDTAVNFGTGRLNEFIATAHGLIGTSKWPVEARGTVHDDHKGAILARQIIAMRMEHRGRRILASPNQVKFLRGWLNRDKALLNWGSIAPVK